jgi:hypothetical protein
MIPLVMRFLFLAILSSLAFIPLKAQESSSLSNSQPTPPYLAPVPKNCHWIVNFSYLSKNTPGTPPKPPPANYPVSIETTKAGTMRRVAVKFVNNPPQQFDIVGDHYFSQGPLGLEYRPLGGEIPIYMYFDLGFAFTQCVNLSSFKEYTTYQGVPVFHYRDGSSEAWISVDTKLPIGADSIGLAKTTYQYLPVPDANAVVLTPEEEKILQNQKKAEDIYKNLR